ncbi:hypothetical protein ACSXCN_00310 [Clostridium perfringens]
MNDITTSKHKGRELAFKILYEDELFKFGFAEYSDEKFKVLTEFELAPNEFKFYLKKMLAAVTQYNSETGKNLIEELYEEV